MNSLLVKLFGFPATLVHGDTLVLDRWLWLCRSIPQEGSQSTDLIDIGCGSGAFTIGMAKRGYRAVGLSWDERNQRVASTRAAMCSAPSATFKICDVRRLDQFPELAHRFDIAICCENIEHILDDQKLINDIAKCLKPGGRLLLTTPNLNCPPMTKEDEGVVPIEDGGHVRRGYDELRLRTLCASANLEVLSISSCSGILSQTITTWLRHLNRIHPLVGWALVLPLRILPPLLDKAATALTSRPGFSITLEARAPNAPA